MSDQVREIVRETILEILETSTSAANIRKTTRKHARKVHFVPIRYRIIGGILQGLNIKFGIFIEKLLSEIIRLDPSLEAMPDSGKKVRLFAAPQTDAAIDHYITQRQLPDSLDDCTHEFDRLLQEVVDTEQSVSNDQRQGIVKDIDALFRTHDGLLVYTELKYNDDHDTGKFADINRKFIKTWAGLVVRLEITSPEELMPIIYYFNPMKRYGPIHTPSRNIMRGSQFFDQFLQTSYADVARHLTEIGDDPDILQMFDDMYRHVRSGELPSVPAQQIRFA